MKNYHITKDLNKTEEAKISNRRHIVLPPRVLNGYTPRTLLSLSTSLANFFGKLNMQRCQREQQGLDIEENINASIEFMHKNISNPLTLNQLAEYARLSVSHYSANFRELAGMAPISFFSEMKIQRAVALLHEPDLKLKDIAAMVGIKDPYYFSRCFKKSTGYSPTSYRKKNAYRNYIS